MSSFDEEKCQEMSQSISAIFDHSQASLQEACAATSLALRVALDNESDKILRAYLVVNVIKHLTMDKKTVELIRPN